MLLPLRALATALILIGVGCSNPNRDALAARVSYYRARAGGPATYPAYARLGTALFEQYRETGDERLYAEALQQLEQSLKFQRNAEALLGIGLALSEKHQFKKALPYLREALASMPENPDAQAALFDANLALGDLSSATASLEQLRRGGCGDFVCRTRAAALAEYRGDYPGAIADMQRAAEAAHETMLAATTRAWAEVRLGSLWMMNGNAAAAREHYERALNIVPRYFFAREHLGEWHAARGEWAQAENIYRALLKDHPEHGYRIALAETLEARNRTREARELLENVRRELRQAVAGGTVDQYRELAILLLCGGDSPAEALDLAHRDWALREDIFATDTLAWALSANGEHGEAMRSSAAALSVNTNHPALLLHGALVRLRSGRAAEALPMLARAKTNPLAFTASERKALAQAEKLAVRALEVAPGKLNEKLHPSNNPKTRPHTDAGASLRTIRRCCRAPHFRDYI